MIDDEGLDAARQRFLDSGVAEPPREEFTWQAPIPLTPNASPPVFPAHRMAPWLEEYVVAVAEYLQVPVDLPSMLSLAALATAAGGRAVVQPWPGWREPLNLFVTVAMAPGERKTPVFQRIIYPIEHAERLAVDAAKPEVTEARIRAQVAKAKADKADKDAEVASEAARDEAVHFATQMRLMAEAITVPIMPRLLADDCTPESLTTLMHEQGGRISLFSDEGELFYMMAGRYSSNGPNLGVYLKAHVGSPIRVDRKGREPEFIERPAMTMGLTIQPRLLHYVAGIDGARGRGLLGRFLWSVPRSMVGYRQTRTEAVPPAVEERYHEYMAALIKALAEWTDPVVLVFTDEAGEALRAFQQALEPRLAMAGDLVHMTDWGAKLVGHTARIAGLLHLATNVDTGWRGPVEASFVHDAVKIAEYLIVHASIAFDEMRLDPLVEDARAVFEWVCARETFSRRDIYKAYQYRFPTVRDVKPVLDLLRDHHIIAEILQERPTTRGRPFGPRYAVNPRTRPTGL